MVGKSSEIKSRNLRSLVRKIENFLKYLETQKEYKVEKINIGDGLIILKEELWVNFTWYQILKN